MSTLFYVAARKAQIILRNMSGTAHKNYQRQAYLVKSWYADRISVARRQLFTNIHLAD